LIYVLRSADAAYAVRAELRLVLSQIGRVGDVLRKHGVMVIAAAIPYPHRDGGRKAAGHGANKIADPDAEANSFDATPDMRI